MKDFFIDFFSRLETRYYHWPALLIFLFSLSIGSFIVPDYGIGWDEQQQRGVGFVTLNYIENNDRYLFDFQDRDYGVAIELPLMILERLFQIDDSRQVYLTRHAILHLLFLCAALSIYFLSYALFKNRVIAIFSLLALILHPRIYAHSFFNSKDIPFLDMYLICFAVFYWADQQHEKFKAYLILGVLTGILCNLRIMGLMFFISIIGYLLISIPLKKVNLKPQLYLLFVFGLSTLLSYYLSFPYLWEAPWPHFVEIFNNMSQFRWQGSILLDGELISYQSIPWNYFSFWFSITTPLLILFLGSWGGLTFIYKHIRTPFKLFAQAHEYHTLLYLLTFIGGATAVIIFDSVLYNGWRQLFFLYPAYVLLAAYGLNQAFIRIQQPGFQVLLKGVLFLQFCLIVIFNIFNHPMQHLYFNPLVSKAPEHIQNNYEYDYWGLSYKAALELILSQDKRQKIKVHVTNWPGILNTQILGRESQQRLSVDIDKQMGDADYFISNTLFTPEVKNSQLIYNYRLQNSTVFRIWKANKKKGN